MNKSPLSKTPPIPHKPKPNSKRGEIIKFRATGNEKQIISKTRELLGLNNDSAVVRILINMGLERINLLYDSVLNVTHPLKYSEIDFLTTSLNIFLKDKKRSEIQNKP